MQHERDRRKAGEVPLEGMEAVEIDHEAFEAALHDEEAAPNAARSVDLSQLLQLRRELLKFVSC